MRLNSPEAADLIQALGTQELAAPILNVLRAALAQSSPLQPQAEAEFNDRMIKHCSLATQADGVRECAAKLDQISR